MRPFIAAMLLLLLAGCAQREKLPVLFTSWDAAETKTCHEVSHVDKDINYPRILLCDKDYFVQWWKAEQVKSEGLRNLHADPQRATQPVGIQLAQAIAALNRAQNTQLLNAPQYSVRFTHEARTENCGDCKLGYFFWDCTKSDIITCQ